MFIWFKSSHWGRVNRPTRLPQYRTYIRSTTSVNTGDITHCAQRRPTRQARSRWRSRSSRDAGWERWAGAAAVFAVIAVFASTYSVPISEQRHRTLNSFLFFMLSNPYVLTTIAIALTLGAAGVLRGKA